MKRIILLLLTVTSALNSQPFLPTEPEDGMRALTESVCEVIPIKYALASDIQEALDFLANEPLSSIDRHPELIRQASADGIRISPQTKVLTDERSNSLLIWAPQEDMEHIRQVISRLDIVMAQILIEAVILEVSFDNTWGANTGKFAVHRGRYRDLFPSLKVLTSSITDPINRFTSLEVNSPASDCAGGFSYLAALDKDLDSTMGALATIPHTHARVLQRPRMQTSDGVPATIFVGALRLYPPVRYKGGGPYFPSIAQLTVGSTIEVTPFLRPNGLVRLNINQNIDTVISNISIVNVGEVPVTTCKKSEVSLVVRERQTVLLGGRIETIIRPLFKGSDTLADIPFAGSFLNDLIHVPTRKVRSEVVVLIQPINLPSPEAAARLARAQNDRMPEVRNMKEGIQQEESGAAVSRTKKNEEKRQKDE